jgi:hypothetical protein
VPPFLLTKAFADRVCRSLICATVVGERSSLSLSTLELAKAWSQAGFNRSTGDLKSSVNTISSVRHRFFLAAIAERLTDERLGW